MRYASSDAYTGQFNAGFPEGKGLYVWKNGQQLDGEWKNRQLNGQGRMTFAYGDVYAGQFVNGQFAGQGSYRWSSGDEYTGQWKSVKKHGKDVFTTAPAAPLAPRRRHAPAAPAQRPALLFSAPASFARGP